MADDPTRVFSIANSHGTVSARVNTLLDQAAEGFYFSRFPCDLELYYLTAGRSDCEMAARQCARSEPSFAYNVWGLCEMSRGNLHTAAEKLRRALSLTEPRQRENRAKISNNWGIVLTRALYDRGAVQKYDDAIQSDSGFAPAHFNRALALTRMGNVPAAIAGYKQAIAVDPKLAEAYVNLGVLVGKQGQLTKAADVLRAGNAQLPYNTDILFNLALTQQEAGNRDAAIATYERVIDIDPRSIEAYSAVAALLAECGRLRAAVEELKRALSFAGAEDQARLKQAIAEASADRRLRTEPPVLQMAGCTDGQGTTRAPDRAGPEHPLERYRAQSPAPLLR
jgi:tetratricopeptide (TPR) repeat protein